jgi:hypothetical protein
MKDDENRGKNDYFFLTVPGLHLLGRCSTTRGMSPQEQRLPRQGRKASLTMRSGTFLKTLPHRRVCHRENIPGKGKSMSYEWNTLSGGTEKFWEVHARHRERGQVQVKVNWVVWLGSLGPLQGHHPSEDQDGCVKGRSPESLTHRRFCLFACFCSANEWIQGLVHAMQVLYHWAPHPAREDFLYDSISWDKLWTGTNWVTFQKRKKKLTDI